LTEPDAEFDSQSDVDEETIRHLDAGGFQLEAILSSWEQRYIDAALRLIRGNSSAAARSSESTERRSIARFSGRRAGVL